MEKHFALIMIRKIAKKISLYLLFILVVMIGIPISMLGGAEWVTECLEAVAELDE